MKKFLISILLAFMVVMLPASIVKATESELPKVTNHEKVTIHLFYASWCGHCHDFIDYFKDKYEDYADYFEIKAYLVSTVSEDGKSAVGIPENVAIRQAVNNHFKTDNNGEKLEGGIPLIVIGDSFVQSGFGKDGTEIIKTALKEYENKKYKDVVANIIKENKLDTSKITNFKTVVDSLVTSEETEVTESTNGKYDTYIIVGIFVLLIGGFAGLVVISRK